jgi:hypothetical protein
MTEENQSPEAPSQSTPTAEEFTAEITRLKAELERAQEAQNLNANTAIVNLERAQKVEAELVETQKALDESRVELAKAIADRDSFEATLDEIALIPEVDAAEDGGAEAVKHAINYQKRKVKRLQEEIEEAQQPQQMGDQSLIIAEAVREACAQEAGASGHWVRERVNLPAILASLGKK